MKSSIKTYQIHSVKQSLINNFGKITLLCGFVVLLVLAFGASNWRGYVSFLPFLALALTFFIITNFCKRVAQSVTFDTNKQTVEFCLVRGKGKIKVAYGDIEKVYVNGYALFYLNGRKVMFNDLATDQSIIQCIKAIGNVSYGPLAKIDKQC